MDKFIKFIKDFLMNDWVICIFVALAFLFSIIV